MEDYNFNKQNIDNNINEIQQNIQTEDLNPENNIKKEEVIENKEEKKIKNDNFLLMNDSELQEYLLEKKCSKNLISQITENNLNSNDLINLINNDEELIKIFGENYHDINFLKSLIKTEIDKNLKVKILLNDDREITLSLENDPEYTLENITHNLGLILDSSNKIFLTPKSNISEILLPNIKIIPRILSEPEKYCNLKVFNLKDVNKKGNEEGYSSYNVKNYNKGYTSSQITNIIENKKTPYSSSNIGNNNYISSNYSNPVYSSSMLNNQNNNLNQINSGNVLNNTNKNQKNDNLNKDSLKNQNQNIIQKIEKKSYTSELKKYTPNEENDNQHPSYLYSSMNKNKYSNYNRGYNSNTAFQIPTKENDNKNEINQNYQYSTYGGLNNYQGFTSSFNNQGSYY